jgi:hypothetical protein
VNNIFGFGNEDLNEPTRENNPHRTYHIAASEYYPAWGAGAMKGDVINPTKVDGVQK